jgi:hypothetical protein
MAGGVVPSGFFFARFLQKQALELELPQQLSNAKTHPSNVNPDQRAREKFAH